MRLSERIGDDIKTSMKRRDRVRVEVLRMVNSKILEKEVELRSHRGRDYHLSDEEIIEVLASYAKQRRQSIEGYREGGRDDLAEKEERELEIVNEYLPEQLSEEAILSLVAEAIEETGASSLKEMGDVMRAVMPRVKGRADGRIVSEAVRNKLSE